MTDIDTHNSEFQLSDKEFFILRDFIEKNYGLKIPDFKKYLLQSRLMRRMRILGLPTFKEYVNYVFDPKNVEEIQNMIDVVTTHKTEFFRENDQYEYIYNEFLPLVKGNQHIKVWSAGCSTGEEVYSLAMIFSEFMRVTGSRFDFSIYGSDVSCETLEYAVNAVYPMDRIEKLSLDMRNRYFLKNKNSEKKMVKIVPAIRDKTSFFYLNFNQDKYNLRTEFDIVLCLNTLIYFNKPKQEEILQKISEYIKPEGLMFIGHSESLFSMNLPFKLIQPSIYKKINS